MFVIINSSSLCSKCQATLNQLFVCNDAYYQLSSEITLYTASQLAVVVYPSLSSLPPVAFPQHVLPRQSQPTGCSLFCRYGNFLEYVCLKMLKKCFFKSLDVKLFLVTISRLQKSTIDPDFYFLMFKITFFQSLTLLKDAFKIF